MRYLRPQFVALTVLLGALATSGCTEPRFSASDVGGNPSADVNDASAFECESDCPRVRWFETWGDGNDDWAVGAGTYMDVETDADGTIYVLGSFGGDMTLGSEFFSVGRFGGYIARFNPEGTLGWVTGFGTAPETAGDVVPMNLQIHPINGDVYVAANGWGSNAIIGGVDFGPQNVPNATMTVARIDAATGAPVWAHVLDPDTPTRGEDLDLTTDGRVLIVSQSSEQMVDLPPSEDTLAFVAWLDADTGEILDGFHFGDSDTTILFSAVAELPNGDVVVGGWYGGGNVRIADEFLPTAGTSNAIFARFTPEGELVQVWALSEVTEELLLEIAVAGDGDFFVSGRYSTATTFADVTLAGSEVGTWLTRIDGATGDVDWVTGHVGGGNAKHGIRRLYVDENDDLHFTVTTSTGAGTLFGTNEAQIPLSGFDTHLLHVDGETGAVLSNELFTIGPEFISNTIAPMPDGGWVFAGNFASTGALFGEPFIANGHTEFDHFLIRLNPN